MINANGRRHLWAPSSRQAQEGLHYACHDQKKKTLSQKAGHFFFSFDPAPLCAFRTPFCTLLPFAMTRISRISLSFVVFLALSLLTHAAVPQDVWKTIQIDEIMETVRNIGVERTVGTPGHQTVQTYIETFLRQHAPDWKIEKDEFSDNTPVGQMTFTNFIATLDAVPGRISDKYLVLAAHYESKMMRGQRFEAAIDSAVPCAILLQFARHFNSIAKANLLAGSHGHNWGIKIIFFDGEEAFHEWTPTDSIYGSRHLAQDWASGSEGLISKIKLFVLLDLLGAPNMVPIPSRYPSTAQQFNFFVQAQTAAQAAGKYVLPHYLRINPSLFEPYYYILTLIVLPNGDLG